MPMTRPTQPDSRTRRAGFTLVELLVTIAIIAVLLGIVIAGLFGAQSFAKRAAGTAQLQAIAQGLDAFQTDMGFYPPLISHLNDATGAIETPETLAAQVAKAGRNAALATAYREARFMSEWSIAAFLIGEGDLNGDQDADPAKLDQDDGKVGNGIRNPGASRAWKIPSGDHLAQNSGREYGPYLDTGFATKFLRRVPVAYDDTSKRIVRDDVSRQYMFQLVDAFDVPVRYYQGWTTRDSTDEPTLLELPIELRTEAGVEKQIDTGRASIEPERSLMTAPYGLLSAGARADRFVDSEGDSVAPFGDVVYGTDLKRNYLQADASGVFKDQSSSPMDPAGLSLEEQKTLLQFLKSNIRYIP